LASGSNLPIGTNLGSQTPGIQHADEFILNGRRVMLIDTPGSDDLIGTDILKSIEQFLATK
jgi:hypothetical protein